LDAASHWKGFRHKISLSSVAQAQLSLQRSSVAQQNNTSRLPVLCGSGTMQRTERRTHKVKIPGGENGWFLQKLWQSTG
jgi:hypothetical protein